MKHIHKLSTQKHFDFLNQERRDPITGDLIKENDEVIICSSCKSAFLKETWEYLENTHCEQKKTLDIVPQQGKLTLRAGLITSLKFASIEDILIKFTIILIIEIIMFSISYSLIDSSLIALLTIGMFVLLAPIAIGMLVTPTIKTELHSSHLLIKKLLGNKRIDYDSISYITIQCFETENVASRIHIKFKNRGTYDILLNKLLVGITLSDELLDFVVILSRYTKVTMKITEGHQEYDVNKRNLDVTINVTQPSEYLH